MVDDKGCAFRGQNIGAQSVHEDIPIHFFLRVNAIPGCRVDETVDCTVTG